MVVAWVEDLFQLIGSFKQYEFCNFVSRSFIALSVFIMRVVKYVNALNTTLQAVVEQFCFFLGEFIIC
jgi:hypothetical protein